MKKNYSIKKTKGNLIAFLVLFCSLFAQSAMAQITYTWNGSTSTTWADPLNWTPSAGTSYPGTLANDIVVINNNSTTFAPTLTTTQTIASLTISNAFGSETGAILTIASTGTLNVNSNTVTQVTLAGGNIVNSGTLSLLSTSTAATQSFLLASAAVVPASPTEYGYSGLGTLSINIATANTNNAAAVFHSAASARTTYKMLFNSATTTFTLASSITVVTTAVRVATPIASTDRSPLIIGGTGFKLGTPMAPVRAGLLVETGRNIVTIDTGTTLELHSLAGSINHGINIANATNTTITPTFFTNKGTINIYGETNRGGVNLGINITTAGEDIRITFVNDGVINVDMKSGAANYGAYTAAVGSPQSSTASIATITNNGSMTFKNSSVITGCGQAIWGSSAGQRTYTNFINNGSVNFDGSIVNIYQGFTLTNNGIVTTNSTFAGGSPLTNSATGIINYTNTHAAFTVLTTVNVNAGAVYTDASGNVFTVRMAKVNGTGTILACDTTPTSTIPATGTLTLVSGTGDASIPYTGVNASASALSTNAASVTTISGTINTGKGAGPNLNTIAAVNFAPTATSVLSPGGLAEKGIMFFTRAAATTLNGSLKIQVAGNTTAGVDYDQIVNSTAAIGFDITAATLDLTGIYTPVSATSIDIVSTNAGTITGPFATVTGLTAGWSVNYGVAGKVQLVYDVNYVAPSVDYVWDGSDSSAWTTAANWTPPGLPDQNSDVTIAVGTNQPTISTDASIKSLIINSLAILTVIGPNLTVKEAITNNGTMTLASNSNLIQVDNVANTGNITVNRNSNALSRLDYTLWSSPMTNSVPQSLSIFSPATDVTRFYTYNEGSDFYNAIPAATAFVEGTGYLIRMPNTAVTAPATQTFAGIFTGVPNNGDISKGIIYGLSGYNAIGNPYPSTINAQAFIAANTTNIESSLYFWRKINGAAGSAYAVFNSLGSTRTASSALPNGIIQVGQGFFVKSKSVPPVNVNFTNAMRVANNQNQIFKTKQVVQKDRVWLNLSRLASKIGTIDIPEAFSQTLIGYTADATSGVDMYDAKYINDSNTALTSGINNEEYTIQGRPAFDASDVVALNFKNDADVVYTIALDQFDGVFATGQDIYLLDSKTGVETDLKAGSYTFAATAGVDNTRFSLKYQKTLKIDAPAFNENSVRVYKNNGALYVNSGTVAISNIKVFDIQGRLLAEQKNLKATSAVINNLRANHQVLIVKIASEDNNEVTKKVVN